MTIDTRLRGGTVVFPRETAKADVLIDGDRIAAVVDPATDSVPEATDVVDVSGCLVLPGLVDPHTHVADYNTIDTYETASAAAALGGVTSFLTFAWQAWTGEDSDWEEPGGLLEAVDRHHEQGPRSYVDYGLHAVVTQEDEATLDALDALADRGVTSIKLFTTYDCGVSEAFVDPVLERTSELGLVVAAHTEDDAICTQKTEQAAAANRSDVTTYPDARPAYAEALAVDAMARAAIDHGAKYYGVHTTSEAAVEAIARYSDEPTVRAETCPHYLTLTADAYAEQGQLPVISPPLREDRDRDALFAHLESGTLAVIGSDHVANTRRVKERGDWWDGPYGANSLQTSLSIVHDEAIVKRGFSYPFLARVMSDAPARTFGLESKGRIEPGRDADLVVFDPDERWTIDPADNASKADFSIYEGREVTGRVKQTFVRGTRIVDDSELVADPGHGTYLERRVPEWERGTEKRVSA